MEKNVVVPTIILIIVFIVFWDNIETFLYDSGIYKSDKIYNKRNNEKIYAKAELEAAKEAKVLERGFMDKMEAIQYGLVSPVKGYRVYKIRNLQNILDGIPHPTVYQRVKDNFLYFLIAEPYGDNTVGEDVKNFFIKKGYYETAKTIEVPK